MNGPETPRRGRCHDSSALRQNGIPSRLDPNERRPLTIVAGFPGKGITGRNGSYPDARYVVLAADSEASSSLTKSSVPKISIVDKHSCKCLIGGAGNGDYIEFAVQEVDRELGSGPFELRGVRECIERVVTNIHNERIFTRPREQWGDLSFELLCALWVEAEGIQLVSVGCGSSVVKARPESIGIGAHLARYLIATYHLPSLSLYQSTHLAAYLLDQVKRFVMYCGGDSQIVWMDDNGGIETLNQASIKEHEKAASLVVDAGSRWLVLLVEPMGWNWDLSRVDKVIDDLGRHLKLMIRQAYPNLTRRRKSPPPATKPEKAADTGQPNA